MPGKSVDASMPRLAAPAIFFLGQSIAFLFFYRNALGGLTLAFIPHLTLSVLLIAAIYGLSSIIGTTVPRKRLRGILLWLTGLAGVIATSIFYLSAIFTLFGFRDLPTRGVIVGYFTQIPTMAKSLPIPTSALAALSLASLLAFLAVTTGIAWCLAGLRSRILASPEKRIRPTIALMPAAVFLLLILAPPAGFFAQLEPWLRSLYNRPLAESGLGLQSNPVEEAFDKQLEAAYPNIPIGKRLNVVLIYVDGLRADILEPYGSGIPNMPFMHSLVTSGELQQFQRTFSTCSMTLCGLGSLLQSRPAHRISTGNLSLPKILHRQGYDTRYLLSGDHQHFLALRKYYDPADFYMDGFDLGPSLANDDLAIFNELHRIPNASEARKPQFLMFGVMSVHIWGKRHEAFRRWQPDKLKTINFSNIDQNSTEAYRNNYLNGVLQADHVLKTIWKWLDSSGYLETSIVVITSDHGDSLGENGHLGHARSLHTPELLVPLWIHTPSDTEPTIPNRNPVFQDDIAPTILDYIGLPIPESWTGISLLQNNSTPRWLPLYYINSKDKFGLIKASNGQTLKYLVDYSLNKESIYDLNRDLFEAHNILNETPPVTREQFRAKLQSTFGTLLPAPTNSAP